MWMRFRPRVPPSLIPSRPVGRVLRRLADAERRRDSFAIETTLSSTMYARRMRSWKTSGYRVALHFIELPSEDFAVRRVAMRVAAGGHSVPELDIRRRYHRGWRFSSRSISRSSTSGIIGSATTTDFALASTRTDERILKLEVLLEAARRANWDALHGPRHLRAGRFRSRPSEHPHADAAGAVPQSVAPDGASRRR
jgi:predicted ABC-type ATPase